MNSHSTRRAPTVKISGTSMMSQIELAKASNDGSMILENCDVMDQLYSSPMHRGD